MTFSKKVKEECLHIQCAEEQLKYEFTAIIKSVSVTNYTDSGSYLEIKSLNANVVKKALKSLKLFYPYLTHQSLVQKKKSFAKSVSQYIVRIYGDIHKMLYDLKLINSDEQTLIFKYNDVDFQNNTDNEKVYIRMIFCTIGTINDPRSVQQYHLEFTLQNINVAKEIQKILKKYDINMKISCRVRNIALYLNKSEEIADFLKYIETMNSLFEFEDFRLTRDIHAINNRINNAEIANEVRQQTSSLIQIHAIEYFKQKTKLENFSKKTIEIANLRILNPNSSLQELAEISGEISKSNIRHHLKKITDEYDIHLTDK